MIHITLSAEQPRDPETEPLGRDRVGFSETMSPGALYDANHGTWVIGRNHFNEKFALFTYKSIVRQAVEIQRIETVVWREDDDTRDNRSVIHGKVLEAGHPVYDKYVGKPSPLEPARNPVRYYKSPLDNAHPCRCGCGDTVTGADFKAGHDQTALHDRVRQIGTVADFLDWFDIVRGPRPNAASR